jgi:hypothetical protein
MEELESRKFLKKEDLVVLRVFYRDNKAGVVEN